jgi:RND superfamily putative drug exporter
MRTLATWCVRHRRLVVLFWLSALVIVTIISQAAGTDFASSFSLPNTPSTKAVDLLESASPRNSGDQELVVFQTTGGLHVTTPSVENRITAMLGTVAGIHGVASVLSPYAPQGASQVNGTKTVAFATVNFAQQTQSIPQKIAVQLVDTAQRADTVHLAVAVSGQLAESANKPSLGGTGPGIILAAVVLLLVFGSLFAAALPIVSAMASLGIAVGFIELLSHVMKIPQFANELVFLIGLGVGIDYALFIVTRHRQGLIAGHDTEESIITAVNTSGRAVLFAGIIVCIALLGMFALGVNFLYGLAVSASLGVAFTMLAALTLLPALLGFIGPRVLSRRQRRELAKNGPRIVGSGNKGFWPRWSNFVQRHPVVPAVLALALIGVIAAPFFSIHLGSSDQGNDPINTTTRQAYDMLASGFGPGFNGPLQLVTETRGPENQAVLGRLVTDLQRQSGVARVTPPVLLSSTQHVQVGLILVYPTTSPQAVATTTLITHLRNDVIPPVVAGTRTAVYVGGTTAILADFAQVLANKIPLFIGLVVLLSFLLLAIVFRSLLVPLTAAVMNLLSIGSAFGMLVAVYQWGWLGALFGVNRPGPIEAFLPVMMFAILFGLSMDYEVFLVTRIHEEWLNTGNNKLAVRNGLAATGKTITAAALIMILIFGSFILGGERVIKEFGLGLAGGILVDAIVIRMTIVPSLMSLFGRANWWFPKRLDTVLPHLSVDHVEPDPSETDAAGDDSPEDDLRLDTLPV